MMAVKTAVEIVREAVEKWEGVTTHDHRANPNVLLLANTSSDSNPTSSPALAAVVLHPWIAPCSWL